MKKTYLLLSIIILLLYSFWGVDVEEICEDSGYFVYEKVNLPSKYIKQFSPDMDKRRYEYRFGLNENYYIDRDKLEKDYVFTFQKREKLKGLETWISITDSIVRKSDGKLLAKQVTYSGYKSDEKPWGIGHPTKDTSCPNGKIGINRSASSFNSGNIVKDVFINKDYEWTPESILGRKAISSGDFEDLCENTGLKVYEKEIIDESYLIPVESYLIPLPIKDQWKIKRYLRYSDHKHYFDIEKLERDYTFTYFENQLVASTNNTRVIRSSITRKKDNKLLAESITVRGRKSDSYTGTINPDLLCSNAHTESSWKNRDIDDMLLRSVFFKDKIDDLSYQASKIEKWNDLASSDKAYTAYTALLKYEADMDLNQLFYLYNKLLPLSLKLENKENKENKENSRKYGNQLTSMYIALLKDKKEMSLDQSIDIYEKLLRLNYKIDDKKNTKKYGNKLISLIKDDPDYSVRYLHIKRRICSKKWESFKDVFIEHCDN
ncbi:MULTISPECIES: hypothetical protein [Colwellia]|uniref:Uncharacterized protein n=1 Tax=Colwellia marinimaniae TaxID=1513592 RepID=A0ABQ0N090_9GAMM|nr:MULTISPECIES: hypothetical protein [Colwellia]GAW97957.1 hypothetical protein MTCD1_03612 [Colwellia marinimaniae]